MTVEQNDAIESHEFKSEVKSLLDILAKSVYKLKEVFLRELISNSSDALNKIRYVLLTNRNIVDPDVPLEITLEANEDDLTITVKDTGIGMTKDETIQQLGVIASSGTRKFLEKLKENPQGEESSGEQHKVDLIGQFGIGFYSVFTVAKKVSVHTRSYLVDSEPVIWESEGKGTFTVKKGTRTTRGTDITLYLIKSKEVKELATKERIREIVKKYSDYIQFPIKFGSDTLNQQIALWRKNPKDVTEEEYKNFQSFVSALSMDAPLLVQHYNTDHPLQFHTLLLIPKKASRDLYFQDTEWGLKLYSKAVLIQEHNKDLLPGYLRFAKGVIDSEDLPLNLSREVVQIDRQIAKIQKVITSKLIKGIEDLTKDEEKYREFWDQYGIFIKQGAITDQGKHKTTLLNLLRFHSSKEPSSKLVSLKTYLDRMKPDQKEIFYLLGDDLDSLYASPHLETYKAKDQEVLLMNEPSDAFFAMNIHEYETKPLTNVDQAAIPPSEEKTSDKKTESESDAEKDKATKAAPVLDNLQTRIKTVLGEKITEVNYTDSLIESPCRLLNPSSALPTNMQKVFQYMSPEKENSHVSPKLLELNKNHGIIKGLKTRLESNPSDSLIDLVILTLFENAMMLEGNFPKPAAYVPKLTQLLDLAINQQKT